MHGAVDLESRAFGDKELDGYEVSRSCAGWKDGFIAVNTNGAMALVQITVREKCLIYLHAPIMSWGLGMGIVSDSWWSQVLEYFGSDQRSRHIVGVSENGSRQRAEES